MADVFISYSRKDIAFARLLHAALKEHEFETWIDWQDIPPSADWLAEVYEAIEGADTFMFVISDSSVTSEICGLEVAHAVANSKRLVPVVVNEVDPQVVHPALAAINWIFFQEEGAFAAAFRTLVEALETNQTWVKQHTRLQVRALEWERKEREAGFLLRGRDLAEAEAWLSRAGEKEGQPTTLQTTYILSSRQAATRRQRATMGAVLVGMAAVVVLAIVAWTQRNQAVYEGEVRATAEARAVAESTRALNAESTAVGERAVAQAESTRAVQAENTAVADRGTAQAESTRAIRAEATAEAERAIAEREAAIARSRQLAANSLGQLESNQELALLLAIEAARSAETDEAQTALREALVHRGRTQRLLSGHAGPVLHLAWHPGGTILVTAGADGTARIWDATTGTELANLAGHVGEVVRATWDTSGERILTAGADGTARIWDGASGAELVLLAGHTGQVRYAGWNGDGTRVITGGEDTTARVWDASSGQEILVLAGSAGDVYYAGWNPDETLIVTTDDVEGARIWDAETGGQLAVLPAGFSGARYAAWNGDGTRIVTAELGEARVWDVSAALATGGEGVEATALLLYKHAIPAYEIGALPEAGWSPDESRILSVSSNGTVEVWEPQGGRTVAFLAGHTGGVNHGEWDEDGGRVLTASDDGTARVWDVTGGVAVAVLGSHEGAVHDAAWSPDGTRVATAGADGTVRVWSVAAVEELAAFPCSVQERSLWTPDGRLIVTSGYGPQVWEAATGEELAAPGEGFAVWDPVGERLLTGYDEGRAAVWELETALAGSESPEMVLPSGDNAAWSRDGTRILTTDEEGGLHVWDAASGVELVAVGGEGAATSLALWSPEGKRVLTLGPEPNALIWDAENGAELASLEGHADRVQSAAWSPDGERIVTTSRDGTARVWEADSGRELMVLLGHDGYVGFAAWDPAGGRIVTAGNDNTARVWDAHSGAVLVVLAGHTGSVDFAAWNGDGTVIATTGWDATARIWDAASGAELAVIGGYFDTVRHAAWSPEGTRLVVTSWGGPARVLGVPVVNMLEAACSYAVRNLSPAEWGQFLGERLYQETCPDLPVPGRDYVTGIETGQRIAARDQRKG